MKISKTKLGALEPIFTMDMPWERLVLLSLSKKRPKNNFQAKGVLATGDLAEMFQKVRQTCRLDR